MTRAMGYGLDRVKGQRTNDLYIGAAIKRSVA